MHGPSPARGHSYVVIDTVSTHRILLLDTTLLVAPSHIDTVSFLYRTPLGHLHFQVKLSAVCDLALN